MHCALQQNIINKNWVDVMFLRNSLTLCGSILSCLCHSVLNLLKVTTDCKMFFSISGFWVNVESHLLGLLGFHHHVLMWSIALEKDDRNAKIQKKKKKLQGSFYAYLKWFFNIGEKTLM